MTEEEASHLRQENTDLRQENQNLRQTILELREALQVALARIAMLEKQNTPPPPFVKPAVTHPSEVEHQPRKKREARHNRGRHRAVPTQRVEHHLTHCPTCALRLGGISLARRREVIDIPPPPGRPGHRASYF